MFDAMPGESAEESKKGRIYVSGSHFSVVSALVRRRKSSKSDKRLRERAHGV